MIKCSKLILNLVLHQSRHTHHDFYLSWYLTSDVSASDGREPLYYDFHRDSVVSSFGATYKTHYVRVVYDLPEESTLPFEIADRTTEIFLNWHDAFRYCESLGEGWRLPTLDELECLMTTPNFDGHNGYYWTSTPSNDKYARSVSKKKNGDVGLYYGHKGSASYCVRAVRDLFR